MSTQPKIVFDKEHTSIDGTISQGLNSSNPVINIISF
jgi:hypothetical protein